MNGPSARSSHLSQPVVKSVLVYRNGDPFFAGRRVVIHEKKVSSFDVFLKEVTGGVQAPFGAVRNIYTPRTGHRIRKLDQIESGGNYVAGGQEAFKKLNYLDIGEIKKRPTEAVNTEGIQPAEVATPEKQPMTMSSKQHVLHRTSFSVLQHGLIANGDLISPASRLLIPRKALNQWDHVLQMVTEKITLRSGAVHRLYTLEGKLVESGAELENGQFYVAVGRDKFKRLPYSELLFDKSAMRRPYGQKASSLPPMVGSRKSKGSGNYRQSKSTIGSSDNSSPQPLKRKGKKDSNSEKPTKVKQKVKSKDSQQAVLNNDEGIFKAGTERSETRGAAEVQEDEDTQVEVPVDQRPAEIVDEEEDGEKTNKDVKQKEDFSAVNGETEDGGDSEAADGPKQEDEIPDHGEKKASPSRVNGATDEENGEDLDQVTEELQPTVDEEGKAEGENSGQDEADLDAGRPPRPEVTVTSPQENGENE
ncbi:Doublecortin domain-containing protein 2 [Microtus ochrogaster]|uniref:Doublecortin domain-containing protein 2 n=1 Tax=Microtus ochrogaster TaxID=79684 RepID=A0A8J6G9J4_MICOH|nr:Doublecortin domain-containing protein 2 [Microtus ochrogaster]